MVKLNRAGYIMKEKNHDFLYYSDFNAQASFLTVIFCNFRSLFASKEALRGQFRLKCVLLPTQRVTQGHSPIFS